MLDTRNAMRALQEQYAELNLEKTNFGDKLTKKSAQLDLAHTAVNDMQNKMNKLSSEQRLVQSELQGQLRSTVGHPPVTVRFSKDRWTALLETG